MPPSAGLGYPQAVAKSRKPSKQKSAKLDPADVLAGRVRPSVQDLIQLISQVNPTGEELPEAEAERRYQEKSALQSLLVNRFSEELAVVSDPEKEGIVLLRHRYGARDACHAVLDELDPDARAWVRLQLDTRARLPGRRDSCPAQCAGLEVGPAEDGVASGKARSGPPREGASDRRGEEAAAFTLEDSDPASLIERSRTALTEFDFELARAALERARSLTNGSLEAVLPWLELLVDHLGLFEEALQGAERLPKHTFGDESIRTLLALAAARAGRIEEAARLATGLTGGRAGEVFLILSEAALGRDDLGGAEADLAHAERAGADPVVAAVQRKALALKRADAHRAAEEAIEALLSAGDLEEAARQARALQTLWPESPVARAALRAAVEGRRAAELREALAAVEALRPGCEPEVEIATLRRALSLGGDREELGRRISTLETEIRAREDEATVARVAALLALEDPAPGLLEYLNLDESLRDRVRQRSSSPMLPWLEELAAPQLGARARPGAVAAALALARAVKAFGEGRVEDAARELQDHRKTLVGVAEATRILAAAKAVADGRQADAAREALRAVQKALAAGDLAAARAASGELKPDHLPDVDRQEAKRSLAKLEAAEETKRLASTFEARAASGDFLAARDLARALAGRAGGPEAERWLLRVEELGADLRRAWRTKVVRNPDAGAYWPDDPKGRFHGDGPICCLTQDGARAVDVLTARGRLFVRVFDAASGKTLELVSLRPPKPMVDSPEAILSGDTLLVADSGGCVVQLFLPTWEILSFHDVEPLLRKDENVEHFLVAPGGRFLWLVANRPSEAEFTARVVDLAGFRVHREISNLDWTCLFVAGDRPRFFVRRSGRKRRTHGIDFLGADGSTELEVQDEITGDTCCAAVHPDGVRQLLVVVASEGVDFLKGSEELVPTRLVVLSPDGRVEGEYRLPDTNPEGRVILAISRDSQVAFVVVDPGDSLPLLLAFAPEGSGLRKLWEARLPERYRLAQDASARRVVLLVHARDGLRPVPLGATPPTLDGLEDQEDALQRFGLKWRYCAWQSEDQGSSENEDVLVRFRKYKNRSAAAKEKENAAYIQDHEDDPRALDRRCRWLLDTDREAALKILARGTELHPTSAPLAVLRAHLQAEEGKWTEVERELLGARSEELGDAARKHLHHLLGMASFYKGDFKAAHTHFLEGIDREGRGCELAGWLNLSEALEIGQLSPEIDEKAPLVNQLVSAILAADEAFGRGDLEAATRALDRPIVWRAFEVQSLARLAEVRLSLGRSGPVEDQRTALALTRFLKVRGEEDTGYKNDLPLLERRWSEDRLKKLEERAEAWLSAWDDQADEG